MDYSFIFIHDKFCFELSDFTDLLRNHADEIELLTKYLNPLIRDGVFEKWIESCTESYVKQDIIKILKKALADGKSTKYIIKRIILELQLSDS